MNKVNIIDGLPIISCYGNFLPYLNKFIYSARDACSFRATNYILEQTLIHDLSCNNNNYVFRYNNISHNFSVSKVEDLFIGVGGTSKPMEKELEMAPSLPGYGNYRYGLYMMISKNCIQWTEPELIINRNWGLPNECCCFDSQSCLTFNDEHKLYLLYTRWNPGIQIRKLQVFSTYDINKWENNAKEVCFDKNINIYTAYVFKHKGKFIGVFRYYIEPYETSMGIENFYTNHKICLAKSDNGLYFTIVNDNIIEDYNYLTHGDITQGHKIIDNKPVIYLLTETGNIMEHEISI